MRLVSEPRPRGANLVTCTNPSNLTSLTLIDSACSLMRTPSAIRVSSRTGPGTYSADPVSSRERPLSNFVMSASSSSEVLTLDKRAGDVMGKIQLGAYLTYSPLSYLYRLKYV